MPPSSAPSCRRGSPNIPDIDALITAENPSRLSSTIIRLSGDRNLAACRLFREALSRHRHAPLACFGSLSEKMFLGLISCCVHWGRDGQADEVMEAMRELGVPRSLHFYAAVMKIHAAKQHFSKALALYDTLVSDGLEADSVMLNCLLHFAVDCGQPARALEFFDQLCCMARPSVKAYMTVLRIHAKDNDFRSSIRLFRMMCESGVEPDTLVLNQLLSICVNAKRVSLARDIIDLCLQHQPDILDTISVNTLIKGHAIQDDLPSALDAFEALKALGMQPTTITYNTLCTTAAKCHECDLVWRLVGEMLSSRLQPDSYTCSALAKTLQLSVERIDEQRMHWALTVLRQVCIRERRRAAGPSVTGGGGGCSGTDERPMATTAALFNALLGVAREAYHIDRLCDLMDDFGIKPDAAGYSSLIRGFAKHHQVDRAMNLIHEMRRDGASYLLCNTATYNSLLEASARAGNMRWMDRVLSGITEDGAPPNLITLAIVVKAYCESGHLERAMGVFEELTADGCVEADEAVYNTLLRACCSCAPPRPSLALSLVEHMLTKKVAPTNVTASICVSLLGKQCGLMDKAFELVLKRMKDDYGVTPSPQALSSVIQGCNFERGIRVFQLMADGLTPVPVGAQDTRSLLRCGRPEGRHHSPEELPLACLHTRPWPRPPIERLSDGIRVFAEGEAVYQPSNL